MLDPRPRGLSFIGSDKPIAIIDVFRGVLTVHTKGMVKQRCMSRPVHCIFFVNQTSQHDELILNGSEVCSLSHALPRQPHLPRSLSLLYIVDSLPDTYGFGEVSPFDKKRV